MEAYEAGGDLEALAEEYGATYTALEETSYTSGIDYSEWLFDEARQEGDCATVEGTSSWYVVVFQNRWRDETQSVNVRHILLNSDSVSATGETEEETDAIMEQAAELLLAG